MFLQERRHLVWLSRIHFKTEHALPDWLIRHCIVDPETSSQFKVIFHVTSNLVELFANLLPLAPERKMQQMRREPLISVDRDRREDAIEINESG